MRRHPRCGCDCRHDGGPNPRQYACCSECPDGQSPLVWFCYVPCDVVYEGHCLLGAGGGRRIFVETGSEPFEVYGFPLAPHCFFDNCRWLAYWRDEAEGINSTGDGCPGQYTSLLSQFEPEQEYSIRACGEWGQTATYPDDFAWELTIADGVMSMIWEHPTYGTLSYESTAAVDCNGNNTLSLTSSGMAHNLPSKLCVYPTQDYPCCCDGATSGGGCFVIDPCYEDQSERCACCDKCCEDLPVTVTLTCSGVTSTYSGNATTGGRTGMNSPAGPSREFCFTHSGHEICLVFYCDGTSWQLDVYCDGGFESSGTVSAHTCCPLHFSFTFNLTCVSCTGCGCGGFAECPECEVPDCCCPDDIIPTNLTATLYDSGMVELCNYTITKSGDTWSGSALCGSYTVETEIRCQDLGGGYCIYAVSIDCGSGGLSLTQLSQTCNPFYWESTAIGSGFCGVDKVIITE